jgi:hypothetical protein
MLTIGVNTFKKRIEPALIAQCPFLVLHVDYESQTEAKF